MITFSTSIIWGYTNSVASVGERTIPTERLPMGIRYFLENFDINNNFVEEKLNRQQFVFFFGMLKIVLCSNHKIKRDYRKEIEHLTYVGKKH
jgi:hypothetical protein